MTTRDNPLTKPRPALLLPVHAPRETLSSLFETARANASSGASLAERLDQFLANSINYYYETRGIPEADDDVVRSPEELALFTALGALRIERARLNDETSYRNGVPVDSYRREMRFWSIWKNPGLSVPNQWLRRYYVGNIKARFTNASKPLQRRVVATLFVDNDCARWSSDQLPVRLEGNTAFVEEEYKSLRCTARARPSESPSQLPDLVLEDGFLAVPATVILRKLETYARIAWARLVHLYYQNYDAPLLTTCIEEGTEVREDLAGTLGANHDEKLFSATYGASPPPAYKSRGPTADSGIAPDKQLTNIVDAIRAQPDATFDAYHTPAQLHQWVSETLPAPHRPSTALSTVDATRDVLERAYSSVVDARPSNHPDADREYRIPAPDYTPFYRPLDNDQPHLWDAYHYLLREQARHLPDPNTVSETGAFAGAISAHDATCTLSESTYVETVREQAQRAAVTEPLQVETVYDVPLLTDRSDFPDITANEQGFLTRVALAMGRLIENYSLTEPMDHFTEDRHGNEFLVDIEKLCETDYLQEVDSLQCTYYEVPYAVRKLLTSGSISHESRPASNKSGDYTDPWYGGITAEGYAEDHPAESIEHRVCVDQMLAELEATTENTTSYRYYDVHRLGPQNLPTTIITESDVKLTPDSAARYGLSDQEHPTAADIPIDELEHHGYIASADEGEVLGDLDLESGRRARSSLADVGLEALTLADVGLDEYRDRTLDCVVFRDGVLAHAAEVQRKSGNKRATRRNFQKLDAVGQLGIDCHWCCPTIDDLRRVMTHLDHPDYLDFDRFPDRSLDTDRPGLWRRDLTTQDLWQPAIHSLSTHRSLEVDPQR
ncbi:hypothetical protein EFA46_009020 [Halarchaeum sp. CBA1220]|uniref:hypothetical protein n=1 Tax=Halarchaeum sp. CBA1220 TaxID=1853682 RepID=UPI0011CEB1E6|nr:hypothetical protein [Halarchaeum sp. CBA1220]QLC34341.1 hypothetical protein EFA46_009020 [Halarchaeum sp. CBA1220]